MQLGRLLPAGCDLASGRAVSPPRVAPLRSRRRVRLPPSPRPSLDDGRDIPSFTTSQARSPSGLSSAWGSSPPPSTHWRRAAPPPVLRHHPPTPRGSSLRGYGRLIFAAGGPHPPRAPPQAGRAGARGLVTWLSAFGFLAQLAGMGFATPAVWLQVAPAAPTPTRQETNAQPRARATAPAEQPRASGVRRSTRAHADGFLSPPQGRRSVSAGRHRSPQGVPRRCASLSSRPPPLPAPTSPASLHASSPRAPPQSSSRRPWPSWRCPSPLCPRRASPGRGPASPSRASASWEARPEPAASSPGALSESAWFGVVVPARFSS